MREFEARLKQRRLGSVVRIGDRSGNAAGTARLHRRQPPRPARGCDPHRRAARRTSFPRSSRRCAGPRSSTPLAFSPGNESGTSPQGYACLSQKDILVHHPFQSTDVVVQFLRRAARDPHVWAIKRSNSIGPPRTARSSRRSNGERQERSAALVEIKARFDEEANLKWARDLERGRPASSSASSSTRTRQAIDGGPQGGGAPHLLPLRHERFLTARIYTDLSRCSPQMPAMGRDSARLFNYITGYARPDTLEASFSDT